MLQGFDDITQELTDHEKFILLPIFQRGFSKKYGEANAVTNKQIIQRIKEKKGITIGDARVRKIINYIRTHNLIPGLVATSEGYYVTQNVLELQKYIKSLQGRENEIRKVKDGMIKYLKMLTGQQQSYLSFTEADR